MRLLPKILAAAALCSATALAQSSPTADKGPDKAELQKHFAEMCADRQAQAVGHLAYLEAKLALTDKQKPLFERWKKIKLAAARGSDCTPPPQDEPSPVDGLKREAKRLQARLDDLKAELPALEALFVTFSEAQKHAFAPPRPPRGHGGPDHFGPGLGAPEHDGPRHGDRDGPDRDGPPPQP